MLSSYNALATPARPAVSRRLLLVEPDETTREAMAYILKTAGHRVVRAAGGHAALALLQLPDLPELILLNVKEAWGFRREQGKLEHAAAVPVVVYAATDCPEARGYALDAVAYLPHPFGHKELLGIVERYCPLSK